MFRYFLAALLSFALASAVADPTHSQEKPDEGFEPMFNGEDLAGWVVVNTAPSTWSFEDGLLVCSGKPIGEIRTEKMYQNFVMEVEWRHLVPRGNAGIFVWADDITARGQPFHRGIEVQVLENAYGNTKGYSTHGDIFPIHGATMTPINGRGGARAFPIENRSRPSPEWNHYRITCIDGNIALEVNGKLVTQGRDCRPKKGYICLESEGGVVHYRNARIRELPDTPLEDGDTAIANRGYRCLYNGIDLDGWQTDASTAENWQPQDWTLLHRPNEAGVAESSRLVSKETFADFGFVIDTRLRGTSSELKLYLHGSDTPILVGLATPDRESPVVKGWNRLEGEVRGSKVSVTLNGEPWLQDVELQGNQKTGPIVIEALGELDIANPFVKSFK